MLRQSPTTTTSSNAGIANRVQSVQFIEMMGEISTSLHQKFTSMLSLLTDGDGDGGGGENDEAHLDFFNSVFPDWYVGNVLGSGATGVVYAGADPETDETLFAIKKSKSGKLLMNKMVYQAIIKVFRLMNHPNIIQYYG